MVLCKTSKKEARDYDVDKRDGFLHDVLFQCAYICSFVSLASLACHCFLDRPFESQNSFVPIHYSSIDRNVKQAVSQ